MLSFKKLNEADYVKKQSGKIEKELPFFITIVSLLTSSGFGPYTILQKFKEITLLPTIQAESVKILKRVDMLGVDPLTALNDAKDKPSSKALGEFLSGYVSAIQSGGNVVNYLKSKMQSSFERFENAEKQAVEKVNGIVHAWLTMQIVVLAVFILLAAVGSNPIMGNNSGSSSQPPYVLLVFAPIMSAVFLKIVQGMVTSNIAEIPVKSFLKLAIPSIVIATVLILTNVLSSMHIEPYVLGIALIIPSIPPALKFQKIYKLNIDAEEATPQILRDITEARKAGIGPEKCVMRACKRTGFKSFTKIVNSISSRLEWGVSMTNLFTGLQNEIKNFQVLISFRILFEIITSGGGNVNTLDSLADTSEKIYNIQKNKREMLKPYVLVGFMLVTVTGFTTLMTIDSFANISQQKSLGKVDPNALDYAPFMEYVSIAVIAQAWLAGLFIGKVTSGAYSGGYILSIALTAITMGAIGIIQLHVINIGSMFHSSS